MINKIIHFTQTQREKILYLLIGGWNTLLGYGVYYLLYRTFKGKVHYVVLLIPANIIAITNAYLSYKILLFRTKVGFKKSLLEYLRFYMVYGVSMLINLILLPFFVEIIGLPILAAQAVVMFITIIISYTGHKYFSFKHNRNEIHQS